MNVTTEWLLDPPRLLVKGIDGKAAGNLQLGIVPVYKGRALGITDIRVGLLAGTGITVFPVFSIGQNGPNYNDIVTSKSLTGAIAGNMGPVALNAQYPWLVAGTAVFIKSITPGAAPGPITLALLIKGDWV